MKLRSLRLYGKLFFQAELFHLPLNASLPGARVALSGNSPKVQWLGIKEHNVLYPHMRYYLIIIKKETDTYQGSENKRPLDM